MRAALKTMAHLRDIRPRLRRFAAPGPSMEHAVPPVPMTAEEFLAWDEHETQRREFERGALFVREGADDQHVTATGNLAMRLVEHLRGSPCRVYMAAMKLRVAAADAYFYPDVFVTCSPADAANPEIKSEPLLVAEVLSPETEARDRGDKFAAYRSLSSLREYLLVDTRGRRCDLFRRRADGLWQLHPFKPGESVRLESLQLDISAEQLWEAMGPPAAGNETPA